MSKDHVPQHIAARMEMERKNLSHNLAQRILSSVNRTAMGDQTMAWLKNVNEDVAPGSAQQPSGEGPTSSLTALNIMDKLFDDFERYSFHFNQMESDRRNVISCIRPTFVVSEQQGERYMGSIQNSHWTVILSAEPAAIRGTFMEARFAYEKEKYRPQAAPFFEVLATQSHGHFLWKINSRNIFYQDLSTLSKMIFARLNRVSRGEAGVNDPLFPSNKQEEPLYAESEFVPGAGGPYQMDMIGNLLIELMESIDAELDALDKEGMRLMKTKGAAAVIPFGKKAEELKHFRAKAASLAMEWADRLDKA